MSIPGIDFKEEQKLILTLMGVLMLQVTCIGQITWSDHIQESIDKAEKSDKAVFVYFTSASCKPCRKMEKYVFTDPRFIEFARQFEMVKISDDFEKNDSQRLNYWRKVTREYNIQYYPVFCILRKDRESIRFAGGSTKTNQFLDILNQLLAKKS